LPVRVFGWQILQSSAEAGTGNFPNENEVQKLKRSVKRARVPSTDSGRTRRSRRSNLNAPAGGVLQRFRALCLSLPETRERSSWGHPNFRAGKKTFATFERVQGRPSMAFRLNDPDIERLTRRKQFFVTPYGRGRWISIWADTPLDWRLVRDLVLRSYRVVALKRMIRALEERGQESPSRSFS
jgi:predicted DNA-binding protein (MmcQ/YjbR family)